MSDDQRNPSARGFVKSAMPQRDDGSGSPEESGTSKPSAAPSVGTGVPHLERACELLWQHGHPAIAEALEREVKEALRRV